MGNTGSRGWGGLDSKSCILLLSCCFGTVVDSLEIIMLPSSSLIDGRHRIRGSPFSVLQAVKKMAFSLWQRFTGKMGPRNGFKPGPGARRVCWTCLCSWGWLFLSSPLFGVRLVCKDSGGCVFRLASEYASDDDGLSGSRSWCKQGLFVTALKHNWRHLSPGVEQSEVMSTKCGGYQEQHLFLCVRLSNWKSKLSAAVLSSTKLLGFHPIPGTSLLLFLSPSCLKDPASSIQVLWVFSFIIQ